MAELDKKEAEVKETLPKQQQLLHEFVIYCQFERRIEEVWSGRGGVYVINDHCLGAPVVAEDWAEEVAIFFTDWCEQTFPPGATACV